jgi:hypothetical protein
MIDYEGVARSIGIECVGTVGDTTKFRETLLKHLATPATSFLCLRLGPRVVPRASFEKRPLQIRFEFMQALNTGRR